MPSLLDIVDLAGTPFCRITVEEEEKKTNVLRVMGQKKCNPSGVRYAQQGHPDSFQRVEAGGKPDSGIFQIIQIYSSFFPRLNSVISRVSYSIYTKKLYRSAVSWKRQHIGKNGLILYVFCVIFD